MDWPEVLDRLEADALRLAAAAAGTPADLDAAGARTLDVSGLDLAALPAELADRARYVLRVLTEAQAALASRATTVRRGLDTVAAGSAGGPVARYIDQGM